MSTTTPEPPLPPPQPPLKARVLVVDDEPDNCHNLADILHDLGYRVDWTCNGDAALELVRRQPYEVALLDLKMPEMDGLTLYREIKKLRAGTVAILVTAYAAGTTCQEALAAGAWQVVAKPIHLPTLLALIEEAQEQPLILVVDDDLDLCEDLWQVFRDQGYRIAVAHDAAEAAVQLRDPRIRVALIDLKLPGGLGTEVFKLVQQSNPRIRTIVITGYRAELDEVVTRVLNQGADVACYKPFDVAQLLRTLDRLTQLTD